MQLCYFKKGNLVLSVPAPLSDKMLPASGIPIKQIALYSVGCSMLGSALSQR